MPDDTIPATLNSAPRVVVVGGGIGGLVAAAALARSGIGVLLLEAQTYFGGCAGTFYRRGYRYDAGATVAAGFGTGGVMETLFDWLDVEVEAELAESSMAVHLPGRSPIVLPTDRARWESEREAIFGPESRAFWRWQDRTASLVWDLALRLPPWPARRLGEWGRCAGAGVRTLGSELGQVHMGLLLDAIRPLQHRLPAAGDDPSLRDLHRFIDGLLLISAQVRSDRALALYGAGALDFPWRGVAHVRGGMGGIADALVEGIRKHGGRVLTRRRVVSVEREAGRVRAVVCNTGERFHGDAVVLNTTPWNLRAFLDPDQGPLPPSLATLRSPDADLDQGGWGAFVLHCSVDEAAVPDAGPLHHQVHLGGPMGEGNTAFISVSPGWDEGRAPPGMRAVTISTHTRLRPWWRLLKENEQEYAVHKASYQDRLLAAAEVALPGFRRRVGEVFAGTPVTYAHYTGRAQGWVGGLPQTQLRGPFRADLGGGLWMVGDSVFPGQSTLAVTLSSLRVSAELSSSLGLAPAKTRAWDTLVEWNATVGRLRGRTISQA